jgi:hypothetical protein
LAEEIDTYASEVKWLLGGGSILWNLNCPMILKQMIGKLKIQQIINIKSKNRLVSYSQRAHSITDRNVIYNFKYSSCSNFKKNGQDWVVVVN